jgi:hypothetical protein
VATLSNCGEALRARFYQAQLETAEWPRLIVVGKVTMNRDWVSAQPSPKRVILAWMQSTD